MVLGLAVSSFAAETVAAGDTKITIGGELRFRGEYQENTANWMDNGTKHTSNYDTRVKLAIKADVNKNTTGMIEFMTGGATNDVQTWDSSTGNGSRGVFQTGNYQANAMNIYQAWVSHVNSSLLGFPVGLKVGHMPLKLGRGLFFNHMKQGDDAIVLFADPTKALHVGLVGIKFDEGVATNVTANTNSSSDADATALVTTYKLDKDNSLGLNLTYVKDRNFYALTGGNPYVANNALNTNFQAQADVYNVGFNADMKFFGVDFYADIEKQWGTCKNCDNGSATAATYNPRNLKFSGLALMLGAAYSIDPVKLTVEYAQGSGDEYNLDKNNDGIRDDTKFKGFITSLGAEQHYTYVYEYRTRTAANAGLNTTNTVSNVGGKWETNGLSSANAGLNNTRYIKVAADVKATKDLTANLSYYNLKSVKGTSMTAALGNATKAARISTTSGVTTVNNHKTSTDIGNELDWVISYQIDKNLKYWVEGGYLWVGAAWDYFDTVSNTNKGGDDIYAIRHGIQLNF